MIMALAIDQTCITGLTDIRTPNHGEGQLMLLEPVCCDEPADACRLRSLWLWHPFSFILDRDPLNSTLGPELQERRAGSVLADALAVVGACCSSCEPQGRDQENFPHWTG